MKGRLFLLFFLVHQVIGVKISHDCLYGNALALQCCKDVPDRKDVILRVPGDCASYYVCVVGLPVLLNCPSGYHWNVEKQICILPELSNCTNSQTNAPSQLSTIKPSKNLGIGKKRGLKPTSIEELEKKIKKEKEMSDLGLKERSGIKSKLRKGSDLDLKGNDSLEKVKPIGGSDVKLKGRKRSEISKLIEQIDPKLNDKEKSEIKSKDKERSDLKSKHKDRLDIKLKEKERLNLQSKDKDRLDIKLKKKERLNLKSKGKEMVDFPNGKERLDIKSKSKERSGVKVDGKWINIFKRKSTKKPSSKKTTTEAYFPTHLCRSADDHLLCGPTSGEIGSSNQESNEKERSDIKSKSKERSGSKFHGKWINFFKRKSTRKPSTKKTTRTTPTEAYTESPMYLCRSAGEHMDCGPTSGEIGSSNIESNEKKMSDIKSEVIKERSDARKMVDNLKKNH